MTFSFTRNCVISLFSFTPEKHFSLHCKLQSFWDNHFPVRILKASSILFSPLFSLLWHSLLKINHFHLSLFFPSASPCDSYTELLLSVSLLSSIISFFVAFYVSLGEVIFCLLLFLSSPVMSVLQCASLIVLSCMRYDAPSAMTLAMKIVFESWWWWWWFEGEVFTPKEQETQEGKPKARLVSLSFFCQADDVGGWDNSLKSLVNCFAIFLLITICISVYLFNNTAW